MHRGLFFAFAVASLTACAIEPAEPVESAGANICCGGGCCLIGGVCFDNGEINPDDPCEQCLRGPDGNATDWSPVDSPECSGEDMGVADSGVDMGSPSDAGLPMDMGGVEDMSTDEDMGGVDMGDTDAGASVDMGVGLADMGDSDSGSGSSDSGGCQAANAAPIMPFVLAMLVARRRRR
ncbi:MAG: MYXO-CTERM sorting domain-containing protein [Myxococcota bacterium]